MSHISTHVLDTSRGTPASEVPVRLDGQDAAGKLAFARVGKHGSGRAMRSNCYGRVKVCERDITA